MIRLAAIIGCLAVANLSAMPKVHLASWKRVAADANAEHVDKLIRITGMVVTGEGRSGSGMFVSPKHYLTSQHVIDGGDCEKIVIYTHLKVRGGAVPQDAQGKKLRCKKIVFEDVEGDTALIEFYPAVTEWAKLDLEGKYRSGSFDVIAYLMNNYMGHIRGCTIGEDLPNQARLNVRNFVGVQEKVVAADFFIAECFLDSGMSGANVVYWQGEVPYVFGVAKGVMTKSIVEGFDATRVLGVGLNPQSLFSRVSSVGQRYKDEIQVVTDAVLAREKVLEQRNNK